MTIPAPVAPLPVVAAVPPVEAFVPDADFRWAAWVARGRVHDQRVRRRLLIALPMIAIAAAIALALLA